MMLLAVLPTVFGLNQNAGIETTTILRVNEVHGVAGTGAASSIFGGDGNGIFAPKGLGLPWGFYPIQVTPSSRVKYMANGYAPI